MTASRNKIDGKPILKLNIHDFNSDDIPFLESLGINQLDEKVPNMRYILIHSQADFHTKRDALFTRYTVLEEKGPKVFLELK